MFFRAKRSGHREYLQLVENERTDGRVRQRVLASLGRMDELEASGQLVRLTESLARLTRELEAVRVASDLDARSSRALGGMLVLERLWRELGLDKLLRRVARGRKVEFDLERSVFAMVANRVLAPRSKRGIMSWLERVAWSGAEEPELHHLYRSLDVLADAKDDLEVRLHQKVRDLFHQRLDLVLYDTTSVSFQAPEEDGLRRRGYSKDKRPDLPQAVLGLLLSGDGLPIGHELFAGNTYDGATVPGVLERLRDRFQLRWLIFVGDRGMVSEKNLDALDEAGYDWIVGVRLRSRPALADAVLCDPGPYETVAENLEVKDVEIDGVRYVACRNPEQARRDAARRQAVVERLEARLERSGVKGLVSRSGFRRFLHVTDEEVRIDRAKIERDTHFDGLWVLETSTELPARDVAEAYKSLWRVERAFRTLKSPLELRPVRHWTEPRIRGHVVVCFLAFLIRSVLERRLFEEAELDSSFQQVLDALHQVQQVRLDLKGIPLHLVTEPPALARRVFKTLGMRHPARLQKLD
jgi:hypothetical protein